MGKGIGAVVALNLAADASSMAPRTTNREDLDGFEPRTLAFLRDVNRVYVVPSIVKKVSTRRTRSLSSWKGAELIGGSAMEVHTIFFVDSCDINKESDFSENDYL